MENKTIRLIILMFCVIHLSGCVFITHKATIAEGINSAEQIVIVKNAKTKEGYLTAIKDWMVKNNHKYIVIDPVDCKLSDQEWALEYAVTWQWDFTIFLNDAEIKAFKNGQEVGNARYNVGIKGGLNLSKWRSAEKTIFRMLDNLFGKE
ncbi:MAG: hypothetical protein KAJ14_00860 [Candidatus Omnitrophica bacterium]|nr:hypothetical protein [Candidatus Omnitrophota bacterium]